MVLILFLLFIVLTVLMFALTLKSLKEDRLIQKHLTLLSSTSPITSERALQTSHCKQFTLSFTHFIMDICDKYYPLCNKSWLVKKLSLGGLFKQEYLKKFLSFQIIGSGVTTLIILGAGILTGKINLGICIFLAIFFGLIAFILPLFWLNQKISIRQKNIQKSLPDFLDLMVICVEAGLGLDMAFKKISMLNQSNTGKEFQSELIHYGNDLRMGKSRRDALNDFSERIGLDDLNTIVRALIQANEMGSEMSSTLRIQAEMLRIKRMQVAEEKANKVSIKMVLPIYLFLFPAIFVVIFGPMSIVMIKALAKIAHQASV